MLLGAHMPTAGGLHNAIRNGKAIGCSAVQVFTSSPQQWKAKQVTDEMVAQFKEAQKETGIDVVVSHDSYLVNLCAPTDENRRKSINGLVGELTRCSQYGIKYAVSHMGAHMGEGEEAGLRAVSESAKEVLKEAPTGVMLLMETTAGQGSSLNHTFEQIAWLINKLKRTNRIGVCLDTCHVFAAGYDIRTPELYDQMWSEFDKLIGMSYLKAIHCNDSKKKLGSHVDRHEHIGIGEIGESAFKMLVNDLRLTEIPILLETPEAESHHKINLEKLKSYVKKK